MNLGEPPPTHQNIGRKQSGASRSNALEVDASKSGLLASHRLGDANRNEDMGTPAFQQSNMRFPEIGLSPNHPSIDDFSMKSTIQLWGYPTAMETSKWHGKFRASWEHHV